MKRTEMLDTYYTVDEVAKSLKVDPRTVRTLIDKGDIKATTVGRQIRISETSLKRYLGEEAP